MDFQNAQIMRGSGQYTGSNDEKTQGLLNVAKALNSLRLGNSDFSESLLEPLRMQIAQNISGGLAGIGVTGIDSENSMIKKIAKDQIDNLIKPDKDLADVYTLLEGDGGFKPINKCC